LLLPGMFVHEKIEEGRRNDALLVPQLAVAHNQKGEPTALVVGPDNKVELRTLATERAIGDKWLVTAGLKAGERVIVEGVQYAKPGATVKPEEMSGGEGQPQPAVAPGAQQPTAQGKQPATHPGAPQAGS
jgi:membrane fusion protein (multidrug efflux system)